MPIYVNHRGDVANKNGTTVYIQGVTYNIFICILILPCLELFINLYKLCLTGAIYIYIYMYYHYVYPQQNVVVITKGWLFCVLVVGTTAANADRNSSSKWATTVASETQSFSH